MRECLFGGGKEGHFCPSFSWLPGLACPRAHFLGAGDNGTVSAQGLCLTACFCGRHLLS